MIICYIQIKKSFKLLHLKAPRDSINETVPTYTREVVNEATTSDEKQAKTITIRYSGNMKPTALGIHACTYHWSVELTTENREKAIEANKWKNHIGYKNPEFFLL